MPFSDEFLTHRRRGPAGAVGSVQGWGLGDVSFTASPGHVSVIRYEARVRADGSGTVLVTKDLGKPTPQAGNVIITNLRAILDGLAPGNYTVSVAAVGPGGTDDSAQTSAFVVPLALP